MTINYDKFTSSLQPLELQFENYKKSQSRPELTKIDREAIKESVIQRFEICYDSLWKLIKRYLIEVKGLPDVPTSPKPLLRLAADNQLFSSSIEKWLKYADAIIDTSHDYSETKAVQTVDLIGDFITDAFEFYENVTGKKWR